MELLYESNKPLFDNFWSKMLELGRTPNINEFDQYQAFVDLVGSVKRAQNFYLQKFGSDILTQATESRRNDLLVYLALSNFNKRVPLIHLPGALKLDIKAFFNTYNNAIAEGREMLFRAGNSDVITELCNKTKFGFLDEQALYIHKSRMKDLCPVLRIYLGCAEILFGELTVADIVKIHKRSGKVSLLRYDDFENNPTEIS
jgi:DNA phosphorothioation-associated putative methyltransferase